ncbi:perforin-1-like [Dendropsophus ebraccatus]|uniref:perforin-1-like n=1 Tax=Dendropsophus ebraccatus TaxID=150705 RepID=UPI003831C528
MASKLCLFFWILLLYHEKPSMSSPILKYGCRPGTAQECKEAKFVPGHTLLGEGINIVTMEATASFLLDLQEVGEKCTVCDNPHNNNVLQKLPKAMVDWRPGSSCSREIKGSVTHSTVSVAEEATSIVENNWKVGLNVDVLVVKTRRAVGGSHSRMATFANSKSVTDSYSFLSHNLDCSFYSFRLGSNASLTPSFHQALTDLPVSYNEISKNKYRRLVESYGTHYITQVKVGGRTQEVTAVKTCQLALNDLKMSEVKDCLGVEAEVGVSLEKISASMDAKFEHCRTKISKTNLGGTFHQVFTERVWKVTGGNGTFDLLSTDKATADAFKKWMESLKYYPGLVSYSVESIHNLVRMKGPKKENLRLAISDYIKEKALLEKCSCPGHRVVRNDCSCACTTSKYTDSDCCPTRRGAAKLHVTIKSGTNLHGDVWTQTDAYVIFKFDGVSVRTPTINNRDNPKWNKRYELGFVELWEVKKYTIEVWDEDDAYDDLLGRCQKTLYSGETLGTCYLKYGSLTYSLNVMCADHLQGRLCQEYTAVSPSA